VDGQIRLNAFDPIGRAQRQQGMRRSLDGKAPDQA
jgi:hypothetical protein